MLKTTIFTISGFVPSILISTAIASACADGPDAYRVAGVVDGDVLNVRSGPGTGFSVVGELHSDAEDLQNRDQVPVNLCDSPENLTAFERQNIWTKIVWESDGRFVVGWVKSRFLSE